MVVDGRLPVPTEPLLIALDETTRELETSVALETTLEGDVTAADDVI